MYLSCLEIKNIKCFEDINLLFQTHKTGDPQSNWNVILGGNGDGKTTLLQAIAVCLMDVTTAGTLLSLEHWVRRNQKKSMIIAKIGQDQNDVKKGRPFSDPISERNIQYLIVGSETELKTIDDAQKYFPVATIVEPELGLAAHFEDIDEAVKNVDFFKRNVYLESEKSGWLSCGYGAFRRTSGFASDTVKMNQQVQKRFLTLFNEGAALYSCEDWLKELDRKATKSKQDSEQRKTLNEVKDTLASLLPDVVKIEIDDEVQFHWKDGTVGLGQLSDGYRSMFALIVDILRWLSLMRPVGASITSMSGIVLIDEIDSHLHPSWQRKIGFMLVEKFPNIQFIVTTHSPFVAMAAGRGALTILEKDGDSVAANQEITDVRGWSVGRMLNDVFAIESLRDPKTTEMQTQFEELRLKSKNGGLTSHENTEFENLKSELDSRLQGENESPLLKQMDEDFIYFAKAVAEGKATLRK